MHAFRLLVVEVAAADGGGRVVADRQPGLGDDPGPEVVRGAGAAHPGGHPARVDGVAEHVGPAPGDGEGEHGVEELAVRVRLGAVPAAPVPVQVAGARVAAAVHAARQVHQPPRALDERREQVGREHVDGQDGGVPVFRGDLARLAVAGAGVMDHRVEPAEHVRLAGDRPGLRRAAEVAGDHARQPRRGGLQAGRPVVVAGMPDDLMTLSDEQVHGGQAEPVR
ncbi:MAG TPA: hypothetical protein VHV09_22970 [Trebonia sp.]|nr:hypothetical protein [Trebonia sp.]